MRKIGYFFKIKALEIKGKQVSLLCPDLKKSNVCVCVCVFVLFCFVLFCLMFKKSGQYETGRVTEIFSLHPLEKLFFKCPETKGLYRRHCLSLKNEHVRNLALHRRQRIKRHTLLQTKHTRE